MIRNISIRTSGTAWLDLGTPYFPIVLLCGAIFSGASLITWAIQCMVQKEQTAKQAVRLDD